AVLPIELRSGLRRRVSEGSIDAARLPAILQHVALYGACGSRVDGGNEELAGAEKLAATYSVRTLDAIHIASAQLFAARGSIPGLTFVNANKRQTETAVGVGLVARHIE